MKLIKMKILALSVVGLIIISSCSNSNQNSHSEVHSEKEQSESDHMDDGLSDVHSYSMDNHMGHMNEVRTSLQEDLGDQYDIDVPASTTVEIEAGKIVYLKMCQSCHGISGKGNGPAAAGLNPKPADFTDPDHSKFYSEMGRLYIIRKGIKGSAMVAWENALSEIEINNVYAYIRSLRNTGNSSEHGKHNHSH